MNTKLLIVGALAVLATTVAMTAYTEANAGAAVENTTTAGTTLQVQTDEARTEISETLADTKQNLSEAVDARQQDYETFKARVLDQLDASRDVTIETRMTASGMIGQPVYNSEDKKIATLKDIILDSTGKAVLVVVSDGGFMGIGDKLAAFDYRLVTQQNADGDVIMPLSGDVIGKVAGFSYDRTESSDKVQVIPENGYSVVELLKGKLLDPQSNPLGDIENITFRNGQAAQVIVAFDEKKGPGGNERAALDYTDLVLAKAGNGALNFRVNDAQAAQFTAYKTTTTQ